MSTTVEAQESESPKTIPAPQLQSQNQCAATAPRRVASAICPTAPGMAIPFTLMRSRTEK